MERKKESAFRVRAERPRFPSLLHPGEESNWGPAKFVHRRKELSDLEGCEGLQEPKPAQSRGQELLPPHPGSSLGSLLPGTEAILLQPPHGLGFPLPEALKAAAGDSQAHLPQVQEAMGSVGPGDTEHNECQSHE